MLNTEVAVSLWTDTSSTMPLTTTATDSFEVDGHRAWPLV